MGSIPSTPPKTQEQQVSQFRYAFRLTPERVKSLTPQQKEEALLEFITLLSLIVSIIYNPVAKEATRLLALDVILTQVQRSARKLITAVTDKSPTYAPETEKRLGLSKNTISTGYKTLEKAGVLKRSHRTDEVTRQDHLDIAPTPALFTSPDVIRDKKKRAAPKPKLQVKPVDPARECMNCGSHDLRIMCRKCGNWIDLGEIEHVCEQPFDHEICDDSNTSQRIPITNFVTAIQNEVLASFPITTPLEPPADLSEAPEGDDDGDEPNTSENEAVTNFGMFSPITPPHVPEEEYLLVEDSLEEESVCSYRERITTWLEQRIGEGQMIYATGKTDQNEKYISFPHGYRPDIAAYIAGHPRHIYGSRLRTSTHTRVLGFDIDNPEQDARIDVYLQKLREAGAFPLYWHRRNNRGHLELYFSTPVDAEAAYTWCLSVCPELADIPECYPVRDKKSNGFSWPLYQRVGNSVYECPISYPARRGLETISGVISDPYAVEILIEKAVTPASLIPPIPSPDLGHGGVLLEKSQEDRSARKNPDMVQDADLADVVIVDFNESHTWEEVTSLCGGIRNNRFCAVWRGEKHPSVVIDPDGLYACDHGRIGTTYFKKLDKYEVYLLSQGIEKTKDLAERIATYRKQGGGIAGFKNATEPKQPAMEQPTWDTIMCEKNERGLPIYCSQCAKKASWYGAGATPYCDGHWQELKSGHRPENTVRNTVSPDMLNQSPATAASQLAKKMANYQVVYLPNVPCTCGCELWRPVLGEMECCRCSPSPLWPNKYDQELKDLYG